MKNKQTSGVSAEKEELLFMAILEFYKKHPGYKMTQGEFTSLICALSQQFMADI